MVRNDCRCMLHVAYLSAGVKSHVIRYTQTCLWMATKAAGLLQRVGKSLTCLFGRRSSVPQGAAFGSVLTLLVSEEQGLPRVTEAKTGEIPGTARASTW